VFVDSSAYNAAMGRVATGQPIHTGGYIHPDGSIQRFHSGGMVGGLKQDEVPAILQTGEMVLNRNQVAQIGAAFSNAREAFSPSTPARGHDGATATPMQVTVYGDVSPRTEFRVRDMLRQAIT